MRVWLDTKSFEKKLNNLIEYSYGFLEGAEKGKKVFFDNLGRGVVFALGQYIDAEARANPQALHHVYEWYQSGSPSARLYDLNYTTSSFGISFNGTFRQSRTISEDSNVPFYNKAKIMEAGLPVVIKPKKSVLVFEDAGETVFTTKPVTVRSPGGEDVRGSFERIIDQFFKLYFTQAFLRSSGIFDYIQNPIVYKKNLPAGVRQGKAKGVSTGYSWIAKAKIEVE